MFIFMHHAFIWFNSFQETVWNVLRAGDTWVRCFFSRGIVWIVQYVSCAVSPCVWQLLSFLFKTNSDLNFRFIWGRENWLNNIFLLKSYNSPLKYYNSMVHHFIIIILLFSLAHRMSEPKIEFSLALNPKITFLVHACTRTKQANKQKKRGKKSPDFVF